MENIYRIKKQYYDLICKLCNLHIEKEGVEKLYKFISFDSNENLNKSKIETFGKGDLYASSPLYFNDPYDCELSFNFLDNFEYLEQLVTNGLVLNREERRKFKKTKVKGEVDKLQRELTKEWNIYKEEIAVCCFTEQVDNFLMWSHYANCYNGICLEYNKNDIKDYLLAAVNYTDQLQSAITNITSEDLKNENYTRLFMSAIKSVFSKHYQWSYEKEWRVVVSVKSENDKYIHMPSPQKLYIGFRLDPNIKKQIMMVARRLGISEIVQTKISSQEYKLIHEAMK